MKKSYYRPNPTYTSRKKTFAIKRFLGVDYTTPKFSMDSARAIDEKNYFYKNNIIQKRNGFEEVAVVEPVFFVARSFADKTYIDIKKRNGVLEEGTTAVNGIWSFIAEDGIRHTVAHIGYLMYEILGLETNVVIFKPIEVGKYALLTIEVPPLVCYEFPNSKTTAFVGGRKLWFLNGTKYMCLRFVKSSNYQKYDIEFFPVEDSDITPIPTTTMSITYKDSAVARRQTLDPINMLTQWRKNKMVSDTYVDDGEKVRTTRYWDYELDTNIFCKSNSEKDKKNKDVELNDIEIEISELVEAK